MKDIDPLQLDVLRTGLDRFYHEGHYVWTKSQIAAILGSVDAVNSALVQSTFAQWEREGKIELLGAEEEYLRVLRPFFMINE